jgi:hypothetical protein
MIAYAKLCECFRIVRELTPAYREEFEQAVRTIRRMAGMESGGRIKIEYQTSRQGPERSLVAAYTAGRFCAGIREFDHRVNDERTSEAEHPADVVVTIARFIREKQKAEHWIQHDLDVFDHMCMELLTGPTLKHAVQEAGREDVREDDDRSVAA